MKRICALTLAFVLTACLWSTPRPGLAGGKESADLAFMRLAGEINLTELKLGKIAQENGSNDVVKKFGERTMRDHGHMNAELKAIASKKGFTLPGKLDQKHQELVDQLSKLRGAEFDRTYAKDMTAGHKAAIKHFEAEAKNGRDDDIRAWAVKWLPTLREHLQLARTAFKDVKDEK